MAYFHLKLVAPRPTFPMDASDAEGAVMQEHFGFWGEKAVEGAAIAVGPVFDSRAPYGMALVDVADEAAAQALADADPVIRAGLGFRYEIAAVPSLILGSGRPS